MQKAGTTVETTDGAAVGTTGGTAVETTDETRLIKEKKDKQVKQERITLSEDNVPISKKPASVKKIRVEQKAPTLVTKCRRVFEEFFMNNYGTAYYWTAKDGAAMKRLIGKLKYSRESYPKPMPTDDDSMVDALKKFLDYIQPGWILDNLDVPTLDGQYNKIIAAKNNKNKTLEQSMQVGVRMGLTDGRDLPDDMTDYLNPKNYI